MLHVLPQKIKIAHMAAIPMSPGGIIELWQVLPLKALNGLFCADLEDRRKYRSQESAHSAQPEARKDIHLFGLPPRVEGLVPNFSQRRPLG